jgi:FKBP-type peptidyl-prolyl cis-trans isomerase
VTPAKKPSGIARGVKLLAEEAGQGTPAAKGDRVTFHMKVWLNHGEEVPLNQIQAQHLPEQMITTVGGDKMIDRTVTLGQREAVAGVEYALVGMKAGGYRKVRISPHLAYREKGLPGLIPENAVLVVELWLRVIAPHNAANRNPR